MFFLSSGHGAYQLAFQVRDPEGTTIWTGKWNNVIHLEPLRPHLEIMRDATLMFAAPGRHDVVLVANSEDLASYSLIVSHVRQG